MSYPHLARRGFQIQNSRMPYGTQKQAGLNQYAGRSAFRKLPPIRVVYALQSVEFLRCMLIRKLASL